MSNYPTSINDFPFFLVASGVCISSLASACAGTYIGYQYGKKCTSSVLSFVSTFFNKGEPLNLPRPLKKLKKTPVVGNKVVGGILGGLTGAAVGAIGFLFISTMLNASWTTRTYAFV